MTGQPTQILPLTIDDLADDLLTSKIDLYIEYSRSYWSPILDLTDELGLSD